MRWRPDDAVIDEIVSIHCEAFPSFFLTQLGPAFLREYYRCVRGHPTGILLTERDGDRCIGFVAGFVEPAGFYRALRDRRLRLGLAAARGLARHPWLVPTLLTNYQRTRAMGSAHTTPGAAELSSLAVRPGASRRGAGARLMRRFARAALDLGATRIFLTTDADGNAGVNAFYRRLGFACIRTFEARAGRLVNEYSIDTGQLSRA